ncbi:hypothetical protein [Mesorhizobium prunaredense]|uniref:hypothetical protein n=1 Tax=Mesorhizobium prunaredense TaxID=1631249 RepID=UPI001FCE1882|nr:hypothetical protein [Mesorhizobium prunaredense]
MLLRLLNALEMKGTLATQMPDSLNEPTHLCMREVARDARWSQRLASADSERASIETAPAYFRMLKAHCRQVEVWRTTYHHPLKRVDGIIEWFSSTGLLPYLSRLERDQKEQYLEAYRTLLAKHYSVFDDGTVLLPFPRVFMMATR